MIIVRGKRKMDKILTGTVHKYGDHIDTDVIIPARELNDPSTQNLARHCMEDIDPDFVKRVKPGDIIVGGVNCGCGSSREHAPMAIKAVGVSCVVAENFARIFFRNSINIGLPLLECPEAAKAAQSGDVLAVDLDTGEIRNKTRSETYQAVPFPEFMRRIIGAGGLVAYTKANLGKA